MARCASELAASIKSLIAAFGVIFMCGTQPACADDSWIFSDWKFAAYAGPVTHTSTFQILGGHANFDQGGLAVFALSREIIRLGAGFSLEGEGQFGQHFAQLHEQEFNLLLDLRYSDFGWSDRLPTSLAVYLGPSYENWTAHGVTTRYDWENYLGAEVAVALPWGPDWSGIFRYHHRSSVSRLLHPVVTDDGTMLGVGIKYAFPE
jgi:hypothetical protein